MKLLFDENLSPKLPGLLTSIHPGSRHVRECEKITRDSILSMDADPLVSLIAIA